MREIIAFGDSYTYGHGLEDCWVTQGDTYVLGPVHSQYSWPTLLAKDLVFDLKNYSQPGMSNLAILHKILNTNYNDNSVCIIMWSFHSRDMIFNENYLPNKQLFTKKPETNDVTHVGNWIKTGLSKIWMLTHNNTDLIMSTWLHIHHANLYLANLKIPHYNVFVNYSTIKNYKPAYVKIPFKDIGVQYFLDKALDDKHPGPLTQQLIARNIKQCLIDDSII